MPRAGGEPGSVVETHELRKVFRGRKGEIMAVDRLDLQVAEGEIFGFLGPNGAGKTTTLRILATLIEPTSGAATVAGRDLRHHPEQVRERIGYVAQGGGSDPGMTGRGELVLQARLFGLGRADADRRAAEMLRTFELADAADRPTRTYSGGMRRRLDVAIGMIHRPRLLFLDEPTTGLDPQARAHLWDEIRRLRADGTSVFLTTHYLEEADALCGRLAIIDHGRLVASGAPDELKRQVAGDVVRLGVRGDRDGVLALLGAQPFVRAASAEEGLIRLYVDRGESAVPHVLRLLDGAGIATETISLHRPSLDDVFLRQTGRSLRDEPAA